MSDWAEAAHCRDLGDVMFPEALEQRTAARLCRTCPVWADCLAEALDKRIEWGVWGGMTERQRRQILKDHPDVTSWRERLAA